MDDSRKTKEQLLEEIQALRRSLKFAQTGEPIFRRVAEQAQYMFYRMSLPDGAYEYVSPAALEITGYPPETWYANPELIQQVISPAWSHYFKEQFQKLIAGDMPPSYEYPIIHPSGGERWLYQRNTLVRDGAGRPVAIEGIVSDITERKLTEMALLREKALTEAILDSTPGIIYLYDDESRLVRWNKKHEEITGYSAEELSRMSLLDWYKGDEKSQKAVKEGVQRTLEKGFGDTEADLQCKDGTVIPMYLTACPLNIDGKTHFLGIGIDITGRRITETALRESERFIKEMQRIARLGGWKANPHTDYLEWTDGVYEILEAPRDYTPGLAEGLKFFVADSIPIIKNRIAHCLATGEAFLVECEIITSSGKRVWTEVRGLSPVTEGGRSYVMGTFQDITERKEAARELEKAHSLLYTAIEHTQAGILVADAPDVRISYANSAALGVRGESKLSLTEIPVELHPEHWQVFHPNGEPFLPEDLPLSQAVLYGKAMSNVEAIIRRQDGEDRYVLANAAPVRDSEGRVVAGIVVFPDITERKRAEEDRLQLAQQLRQAQKMEAIGRLAGGIAHDFNNLLQVMLGNLDLISDDLPPGTPALEEIREVQKAALRAADLTRQLLAFSRRQLIQPVNSDLNELILGVSKMLRRMLGELIDFTFLPGENLEMVCVDRGQCEQVLLNLCVNARDAMPRGGKLTVETKTMTIDDDYCTRHDWAAQGRYVIVSVTDTGEGMDETTCTRIFEPFFTTKELGHGTGLGLSTVYGIVQQHKGLINVRSEPGGGSTFSVFFPVADSQDPEESSESPASPASGGTETILVAEDEPMVLRLVAQILSGAGYTVLTASDGNEALHLFEQHADSINLVLLDVVMPGLSGREVMDQIVKTHPKAPFLFSSGYSEAAVHQDFVIHEGLRLVKKPYRREDLLLEVRRILDKHAAGKVGK